MEVVDPAAAGFSGEDRVDLLAGEVGGESSGCMPSLTPWRGSRGELATCRFT